MYSSDPLSPNEFYLQQDFKIDDVVDKISRDNFDPQCIEVENQGNTFRCYHAGTYILSTENENVEFQILEKKRTYRWSFSIFEESSTESTLFIQQGKKYSLRIWITQLSFNDDIQKELDCTSSSISSKSKNITLSFQSLGEFPIVSFTEFNEFFIEPVIFDSENSYWEAEFTVNNTFLRSLTIKGHDNSNIFDVVSQTSFNFQYKSLFKETSQLFSEVTQQFSSSWKISSINSIPCYPNYAIATVISSDSTKKFFYTNDGFDSILEFGRNRGFTAVYITISGIYYIDNQNVRKYDNTGDFDIGISFSDKPIGFFSSDQCDFYRSYGDQISYENNFIGVFSSKKVAFSYDGNSFRDNIILNRLNLNFSSVSYKWQSLIILATDLNTNSKILNANFDANKKILDEDKSEVPFVVNYDLQNHVSYKLDLPFEVSSGQVKFCSEYGFFVIGNNLLYSPDSRAISSIFLPGHFQSNEDTYITSFVQKGKQFVATASDGTSFCGNYQNLKANQILNNSNDGFLIIDGQQNVVSVGINSEPNGFTKIPVMYFISDTITSYSTIINGQIIPQYIDSGDFAVTNLTIATISKYESSVLIMPPKNTILSHNVYSESTICSTLVTYINRHIEIPSSMKTSSEFCITYYISLRAMTLSTYELQSRRGEGGEEGSTSIQIYMYSNGKVFDVYNVPLIFGCSPKRRLGIRMHKQVCYPDQNNGDCVFTVFYNKFFKPIPLIFDDDQLIGEAKFDFALITTTPVHYKMTVREANCIRKPQTYSEMGDNWSRSTYVNCFNGPKNEYIGDVIDNQYTILNLTNNELKIKKRTIKYAEFKLINLGSASTMCQLEYSFKVKVLEAPINPGYIVLIVIIACIIVINLMLFEYWQYITFMYPEEFELKLKEDKDKKEKKNKSKNRSEDEDTHNESENTHNESKNTHNESENTHNKSENTHNKSKNTHNKSKKSHNKSKKSHNKSKNTHNENEHDHSSDSLSSIYDGKEESNERNSPEGRKVEDNSEDNSNAKIEKKEEENEESKSTEDNGEIKNTEDDDESKNTEDDDKSKNTEDDDKSKNTEEYKESKNTEDNDESKNTEDDDESKNTEDDDKSKNTEEYEESKNTEDNDESKNTEDDDESKNTEDDDESKNTEDDDKSKKTEEYEESKNTEDNDESKNTEDDDESKNTEDNEESKNTEEYEESKNTEDNEESKNTEEYEESKNTEDNDESKNTEDDDESKNTEDNDESKNTEEYEESKNTEDNEESKNTEDNDESKNTEDNDESKNTEDDDESKNTEEKDDENVTTRTEDNDKNHSDDYIEEEEEENEESKNTEEDDESKNTEDNDESKNTEDNEESKNTEEYEESKNTEEYEESKNTEEYEESKNTEDNDESKNTEEKDDENVTTGTEDNDKNHSDDYIEEEEEENEESKGTEIQYDEESKSTET